MTPEEGEGGKKYQGSQSRGTLGKDHHPNGHRSLVCSSLCISVSSYS